MFRYVKQNIFPHYLSIVNSINVNLSDMAESGPRPRATLLSNQTLVRVNDVYDYLLSSTYSYFYILMDSLC